MTKRADLLAYLALGAICLIWGTTYLALRIGVSGFPPFLFVIIRQILAGTILSGFMLLVRRTSLPERKELGRLILGGLMIFALPNGLLAWAEVYIPSGIAAIIASMMPLWVVFLNISVNKQERPTPAVVFGVILGLCGIAVIFSDNLSDFGNFKYFLGILAAFVATFSWATGSMSLKRYQLKTNLFLSAGIQMFFGGLWLIPFSLSFDSFHQIVWHAAMLESLVYLVCIGSIVGYICYFYALKHLPITLVSLYAYVNPLAAVVLGWIILDERLTITIWTGFLITVLGIYIVNRGYHPRNFARPQLSKQT